MNAQLAAAEIIELIEENYSYQRDAGGKSIEHAHWMLIGIAQGYVQHEKAHRWLGYAQALLISGHVTTLEEMKAINRRAG